MLETTATTASAPRASLNLDMRCRQGTPPTERFRSKLMLLVFSKRCFCGSKLNLNQFNCDFVEAYDLQRSGRLSPKTLESRHFGTSCARLSIKHERLLGSRYAEML